MSELKEAPKKVEQIKSITLVTTEINGEINAHINHNLPMTTDVFAHIVSAMNVLMKFQGDNVMLQKKTIKDAQNRAPREPTRIVEDEKK